MHCNRSKTVARTQRWLQTLLCIVLVAICGVGSSQQTEETSGAAPAGDLELAIIVSRHGVRSPTGSTEQLHKYSSRPWPTWDAPPGQLTAHGAQLMTLLGSYYRAFFVQQGLLRPSGCADATHVSFYADSDQRTAESGRSLAAGLFAGCAQQEQAAQHALAEGQADPLFHFLAAGLGQPDYRRAADSIAGRMGGSPASLSEVYRPQLVELQSLLLDCAAPTPCPQSDHTASQRLLDIASSLEAGNGEHLAELKGPLSTASTITENFLLEYTNGLPMDQVAWGHLDLSTLKDMISLHTAASDFTRRTSYVATVQASNLLAHIVDTLQQAATGSAVPGALGKHGDRLIVLVGHDTNLSNIAGMLNLSWVIDGRRDDTPPGGAIVFELRKRHGSDAGEITTYYLAQTLQQMRTSTPLTLDKPPARANLFVPGCSKAAQGYPCDWDAFKKTAAHAIDPAFVK